MVICVGKENNYVLRVQKKNLEYKSWKDQAVDHSKWPRAVRSQSQKLNGSGRRIIERQTKGDFAVQFI